VNEIEVTREFLEELEADLIADMEETVQEKLLFLPLKMGM
jgi:hypothetical protein